jgi:predicted AlkP superfamily phosphohydrolase/phosphomutase
MGGGERPNRVLVVGLDGGTFTLLRPWLEEGTLPCLARLYHEGVRGPLHSVVPPLSPEAWSTFMTGKHPGRHGVMNFLSFQPGSYDLHFNSGADVREPTLWRLLSDAGRTVGVVAVPMTYPPEEVNGYLISGLETPGMKSQFTHPAGLSEELRRAVGGYDLHGDMLSHTTPEAYAQGVRDMVESQSRCATYLFDRYPADLSMVVIGATDRIQHCFWRFLDPAHPRHGVDSRPALLHAVRQVYQRVDAAVQELMDHVPDPKTVLIMSDHGFGPCHRSVHLNRWLRSRGYLACGGGPSLTFRIARGAWQQLSPRVPRWLRDWLKSRLPSVRQQVQSFMLLSRVDWSRTRAFSLSTESSYIYLNRTDRFPEGSVSPGPEAKALCQALMEDLASLCDSATGEPIVEQVHCVGDLYAGPARPDLPDLVVMWKDGYIARTDACELGRRAGDFVEPGLAMGEMYRHISVEQSGSHRADGLLIAHGAAVAGPADVHEARIVDLAPTILYLLGEPVPQDMEGRVLDEIIDPDLLQAYPVQYRESGPAAPQPARRDSPYSPEEAAQLEQNLRDLGYLE